jgi:hypothetical protein
MYTLSPFTCARLKRLSKQPVVWEGDRRPIAEGMLDAFGYDSSTPDDEEASDCIIWVDGTEGVLRAVTIVPADTGHEVVARTLLQAMEHPQGAISPARPHKIVVCDREIHFFLRGALQGIDISVDYAEDLPIIDEIFDSLQQTDEADEPTLPDDWQRMLNEQARQIWENAPWNALGDDQIIKIELNQWSLETLYVSVLGMAGLEYGLLIYRSLDSLMQFRKTAMQDSLSPRQMQQAFLSQDCLFLNFDLVQDDAPPVLPLPWMQTAPSEVIPEFGSLHPLEGLRTVLELEEAAAFRICLAGLNCFFEQYDTALNGSDFPDLSDRYSMDHPLEEGPLTIAISTCPDITAQLAVSEGFGSLGSQASGPDVPRLRDDYIPEGSIILLTRFPKEVVTLMQDNGEYGAIADSSSKATDMVPVIAIQTSRPKAQKLVSQLKAAESIQAVCFNPGRDPMTGDTLELGLLQTGNGDFHLFVEFSEDDAHDSRLLKQWQQWCKASSSVCGVLIAGGITGAARGRPGLKEKIAFFATHLKTSEELGLPPLQMSYALDWE